MNKQEKQKNNNLEEKLDFYELQELYKKIFWKENLPTQEEIKDFLWALTQKEKLEFKRDYISLARKAKNWEKISEILDSEISFHFEELFFRHWVNNIRFWLNIMTQQEQALVLNRKLEKWEDIEKHSKTEDLEEQEKLLREKIWIEEYKDKLKIAREKWDKQEINKLELEISNAIIRELHNNFAYQLTKEKYWYQPSKIQQSKQLYCVWFSIVWHVFLEELWIKHKWLNFKLHSVLEVNIWWKNYLFDASIVNQLLEFEYWEKQGVMFYINWIWWSKQDNDWKEIKELFISWNPEKILLSQIYYNKWNSLYELWKYEEAIKMYDKAIELNPKFVDAYNNKWSILYKSWNYKESIKMYNKALKLDSKSAKVYHDKWDVLFELWDYKEAIRMYDKVIELDLKYKDAYHNKWVSLSKLQKKKLWNLYKYTYNLMVWKSRLFEILYREEKNKIKNFIESEDFEWLRKYLLSLEENKKK